MAAKKNLEYPFERVSVAEASRDDAESIMHIDARNGSGSPPRPLPAAFEERERTVSSEESTVADSLTRRFLYAQAERRTSSRDVLVEAASRAKRAPTRGNLERMRAVANEVSRRRGGGKQMRKVLTQRLVDEITGEA